MLNINIMKKSWADIDEEERVQEEFRYVPPHKKPLDRKTIKPIHIDGVRKESKLPDGRN